MINDNTVIYQKILHNLNISNNISFFNINIQYTLHFSTLLQVTFTCNFQFRRLFIVMPKKMISLTIHFNSENADTLWWHIDKHNNCFSFISFTFID